MNAKSIAIIGGTDGPTSIFITTSVNWPQIIAAEVIIAAVILGLIIWKKRQGEN